jgi:UDP-glucose 4-epimerase
MNILVTGGAGYIGSHTIIDIIEQTDWTPISVDNFQNSTPKTYERIKQITNREILSYDIDLTDIDSARRIFEENKIDGVIHFAALKSVPASVRTPLKYYKNNLNSLMNIVALQEEFDVPNFIFSSSCSVYGNPDVRQVTEDTPIGKTESPYAETKVAGERILSDVAAKGTNLKMIALRYFNPVGAHPSGLNGELPLGVPDNLVPYITQTAIGEREKLTIFGNDYDTKDGTCVRDYIHVCDIANAHVKALNHLFSGGQKKTMEVINLGTGKGVTVKECVDAFIEVSGVDLNFEYGPRRDGDVIAVYANCERSSQLLNWSAKKDLKEMMSSAWRWQQHLSNQSL